VAVTRSKIFMPMAIISVILLAISTLYLVSSVFVNIGLVISYIMQNKYSNPDVQKTALITVILSAVMLFVYLGVTFIPSLVSRQRLKHQHVAH
jgi:voltage-gated potassium channel Kch